MNEDLLRTKLGFLQIPPCRHHNLLPFQHANYQQCKWVLAPSAPVPLYTVGVCHTVPGHCHLTRLEEGDRCRRLYKGMCVWTYKPTHDPLHPHLCSATSACILQRAVVTQCFFDAVPHDHAAFSHAVLSWTVLPWFQKAFVWEGGPPSRKEEGVVAPLLFSLLGSLIILILVYIAVILLLMWSEVMQVVLLYPCSLQAQMLPLDEINLRKPDIRKRYLKKETKHFSETPKLGNDSIFRRL